MTTKIRALMLAAFLTILAVVTISTVVVAVQNDETSIMTGSAPLAE